MTDRTIASRPSLEQVAAIVDFMENHCALALGQLRGMEGRHQSRKQWSQLTRIVNSLNGPTRPMKSWIKFWADKKTNVRAKVQSSGGDSNSLSSNLEKRIWDKFLANDKPRAPRSLKVKHEKYIDENFYEDNMNTNHDQSDPVLVLEERQDAIMEKLVKVMSDQADAVSQMALASHAHALALDRMAEASHIQAQAVNRLATTFESISSATLDVRNAIVGIDTTMKRYYSTSPT